MIFFFLLQFLSALNTFVKSHYFKLVAEIVTLYLYPIILDNFSDKFCAPAETVNENACYALQRGDSEVSCLRVADSAECAIRLAEGEADFGVFNAEELLLTYQFYPNNILPILQLRHKEKLNGNQYIQVYTFSNYQTL